MLELLVPNPDLSQLGDALLHFWVFISIHALNCRLEILKRNGGLQVATDLRFCSETSEAMAVILYAACARDAGCRLQAVGASEVPNGHVGG